MRGRTHPGSGMRGGRPGKGEGGGHTPLGTGRRPKAEKEPRLHPTGPPGLPTPSPKSDWVPHILQQAPPLRRHLGGTPRGRARLPAEQARKAARAAQSRPGGPRCQGACAQRHPTAEVGCGRREASAQARSSILSPLRDKGKEGFLMWLPFFIFIYELSPGSLSGGAPKTLD